MPNFPALVYIDLKRSRLRSLLRRPQPFYWIARNANNNRVLARSSERYTNRQDVLDAIAQLFGAQSTVYLREAEKGDVLVRMAVQGDNAS